MEWGWFNFQDMKRASFPHLLSKPWLAQNLWPQCKIIVELNLVECGFGANKSACRSAMLIIFMSFFFLLIKPERFILIVTWVWMSLYSTDCRLANKNEDVTSSLTQTRTCITCISSLPMQHFKKEQEQVVWLNRCFERVGQWAKTHPRLYALVICRCSHDYGAFTRYGTGFCNDFLWPPWCVSCSWEHVCSSKHIQFQFVSSHGQGAVKYGRCSYVSDSLSLYPSLSLFHSLSLSQQIQTCRAARCYTTWPWSQHWSYMRG